MNISLQLKLMNQDILTKIERQKALEKELNCVFIRINPDEKDFNIFKEINKIRKHIKKFLTDKILKNLLELKFKSNHSKITKT